MGTPSYAEQQGVANQVLALRVKAQSLPFAAATFDAVFAIGSFEMIGEERPQALTEVIRVLRREFFLAVHSPFRDPGPSLLRGAASLPGLVPLQPAGQ